MGDAKVSAPEDGLIILNDHADPKSNVLSLDGFKPDDDIQQQPYDDNPSLVLDQLLPIDMSSPTFLINQTPPAENHVQNSENSNSKAIERLLYELDATGTYSSLQQDDVMSPPLKPDAPPLVEIEQSEDINPFHDAGTATSSVFSVSEIDAQINVVPDKEHDLLQVGVGSVQDSLFDSLDNQHPMPPSEPLKTDHTLEIPHENDNSIIANLHPSSKSEQVTEHENLTIPSGDISIPNLEPVANLDFNAGSDSPKYVQDSFGNRVLVDTAAPFESVKEAVSKFGGIVDWKAHKMQTGERRRFIEQELDKAQEEVPIYRKMSDTAEEEKSKVVQELEAAKRLVEEMKLNLERAQTEEHQARQDAELVKLRVEELEQGIAEESSVAAKAQLEVAKARQAAAVSDLQSAKKELESLKKDYVGLMLERDMATKKAEQAMADAEEVEKTVQDLTIELIGTKELLESAHAVHLEAEERRVTAAIDKDHCLEKWGQELQEVEDEVRLLEDQVTSANDLRSKLDAASVLLGELKAELANYMESKMIHGSDDDDGDAMHREKSLRRTHTGIQASVASAKKELEDVRVNIEKAMEEVEGLKLAASALQSELESEKADVENFKNKDGIRAESVKVLEVDVNKIELELAETKVRESETRYKMMGLTMRLPRVAQEADRVKSVAEEAREELMRVKEEAEQVKSEAIMLESKLVSTEKETEGAEASEKLALGALRALRESDDNADEVSSSGEVKVSLEEYYELGKRAYEAEEEANARVATAEGGVEEAKECQLRSMKKLEEVDQEVGQRKEELNMAVKRAEEAAEGKLRVEEELRQWRSRSEESRQGSESRSSVEGKAEIKEKSNVETRQESSNYIRLPTAHYTTPPPAGTVADGEKATKKKKKSFFPRILMFMARRKAHSSK